MDNIERRLELARGGEQTQKMEKDVIARLDELIKKIENQQKQQQQGGQPQPNPGGGEPGDPEDGNCPPSQPSNGPPQGNTIQSSSPATDDYLGGAGAKGNVDDKKIKDLAEVLGHPAGKGTCQGHAGVDEGHAAEASRDH